MAFSEQRWLPTGQAARLLGVSSETLKRYALRDQFLIEGRHWRRGPHRNSPHVWEVHSCLRELLDRSPALTVSC